MNKNIYSGFVVFEVILSLVITNFIFVVTSVITLGLLFPIMLVSTFNYIQRFYDQKEYEGIIFTFLSFIKKRILKTTKLLLPIVVLVFLLVINVFVFNIEVVETFSVNQLFILYTAQTLMAYQLLGILLHSAIILIEEKDHTIKTLYKEAFLIFNLHPIRSFFSMLSLVVMIITSLYYVDYIYMLFAPLSLFAFYIVNSPILKKNEIEETL